ncbi:MAG: hypothetical protein WC319_04530 [Candidatus Paceibacterota bacterium]|jgi:hypothetical protein
MEITVVGGKIDIPIVGNILKRSCEEETIETFKVYEKYLVKILSRDEKKIIIDWQKREDIIQDADYRWCTAIGQYSCAVFLSLGILTKNPKGAYSFSEEEMNPVWGMPGADYSSHEVSHLYFTRKEDAIAFGRARWAGRMDNWLIFRMGEVITKREICR